MVVLTDDDGQALRMRINDQNDCYCWPTQKFKNILLMRLFFFCLSPNGYFNTSHFSWKIMA